MSYVTTSGRRLYLASAIGTVLLSSAIGPDFGNPPTTGGGGGGGGGGALSVTEWPRDRFPFDSGAWRGQNSANIPVRITGTLGEDIQARLVPTDGSPASAWTDVGTASGGADQLVGYLPSRKRSVPCRLEIRLKNTPLTTAITTNSITIGHIVAIWGQSEHAQWQQFLAGQPTPETLSIKHAVLALKNTWATGRRSTATLKVPGVDALPSGMAISGSNINITGTFTEIADWDFTGFKVIGKAGSSVEVLRDCIFGERTGLANIDMYLFVEVGSTVNVEYCDVTGWDGLANPALGSLNLGAAIAFRAQISGSGAGITVGSLRVRRCRFTNLTADAFKLTGSASEAQVFEWNYIGPAVAFGNDRALHDMGRTYVSGEVCDNAAGLSFICRVATSLGVAPPTGSTSNTDWEYVDPHSDSIQCPAAKNGAYIRFNYIEALETPRNRGLNTSIFLARDANANDRQFDKVYVEWNWLPRSNTGGNGAIKIDGGSGTNITRPTLRNNWIGRRTSSSFNSYLSNGVLNYPFEFGGNRAIDTDAIIPASDFTNGIDVAALTEFGDGRITHLWHDPAVGAGAAGIQTRVSTNSTPFTPALAAISNAVLSVVGDDYVTFVHHTRSGTTWTEPLNDQVGRPWANDEALHLHATGNNLSPVGAVYSSWYAAPSGFQSDYGKVWIASFIGRNLDNTPVVTPATINYGFGSSVTIDRTFDLLYDWGWTKAILPDAHPFVIHSAATPMTWSESGTSNHKHKARCTESIRAAQALPAVAGYFAPRPFAPNGYHNGRPETAGNYDPAGTGHGDEPHPLKYEDRGQNTFARMTAYAILQSAGLLPIKTPAFDLITLHSDGSVMRVGSTAGPITTSRIKNGEASISDVSATDHWTDIVGFEYGQLPVYRALLKPDGNVYVYPRTGTLPTSGVTFGMGGATGMLIHPADNLNNLERNWPLVDFNMLGIDGVPVRQIPTALAGTHPTGTFTVP